MNAITRPDPGALAALARALGSADDRRLVAIVAIIDSLPARAAIDALLDGVRPRLWQLRPPRVLSLRRVLSVPLEPLLGARALCGPGSLRLPRDLLPALFGLVEARLDPALRQACEAECRRITSADIDQVQAIGAQLWPAAAAILHHAFAIDPRGTQRALAASGPANGASAEALDRHHAAVLTLMQHATPMAQAMLPRDGRMPDPANAAAPHRTMLLQAAEAGWLPFRCIAASFLLRSPSPDHLVRLIGQARVSLQDPGLVEVVEEVVASLSAELGLMGDPTGGASAVLADRRSELALRLAVILSELSGQNTRLEALAAEAAQALARQFSTTLEAAVLGPLEGLARGGPAASENLAAIESAARAARRMAVAGRAMTRQPAFEGGIAAARARLMALARRSGAIADEAGRIALPDLVRVLEILSGPDEALAMIEALAAEA